MIGVIGGMGPEATVDLMQRVIRATPAETDGDHIHMIVDNNPKIPPRYARIVEGTGADPVPELTRMAAGLVAMGAGALAIPCNSAHAFLMEIQEAAGAVPVLDMIGLSAGRIAGRAPRPTRVGILAATSIRVTGLYARALGMHGIEAVYPGRQDRVMEIINAVKRGETGAPQRAALAGLCEELRADGADMVLIACTELSILVDAVPADIPALDAMDVLAEAIVALAGVPATA